MGQKMPAWLQQLVEPGNLDQAWIDLFFRYISTQPRGGTVPETFPAGSGWIKPCGQKCGNALDVVSLAQCKYVYFGQDFLTTLRFGMYLPQEEKRMEKRWKAVFTCVYHMLCLYSDWHLSNRRFVPLEQWRNLQKCEKFQSMELWEQRLLTSMHLDEGTVLRAEETSCCLVLPGYTALNIKEQRRQQEVAHLSV